MYSLEQSNLVNDIDSRLVRQVEIESLTPAEIAAVREAHKHPSARAKAEKIMAAFPEAFA